ncbi:MAG TPA: hypothetical protein VN767_01700 [Streptosporangiaceae bacterium]|jgi:hypothetical protein|nr:hypothetical protein [Streptosporangiaceae bacterium]
MRLSQAARTGVRIASVVTLGAAATLGVTAAQAAGASHQARSADIPSGPVIGHPATTTPRLPDNDNPPEQVRQIVQCKGTMYAVGTFKTVLQGSNTFTRTDVMSFSAKAPYKLTSWAPGIRSGTVNSITFAGGKCDNAYIGGFFSRVSGTKVQNIAEISTRTGKVVNAFAHSANKTVETLRSFRNHILVGGDYTTINGSTSDAYMTSLNPVTGKNDKYLDLNISGNYQFPGVSTNITKVYNQAISHSGTLDLVMGDFTKVGGKGRQQIFMLNLGPRHGRVTAWTSPEFDGSDGNLPGGYPYQCHASTPFYVRAAAWSPDDSTIYFADTGYHPWNLTTNPPRSGLCDSASAWPATQKSVLHLWINYTGCDSLYSVAADKHTVYLAGHERWSENPLGCDSQGSGGIPAAGFEGLGPVNGKLKFNPTRDRGLGADDMLLTTSGLWVASDNFEGSNKCAGVAHLAGICFLPY